MLSFLRPKLPPMKQRAHLNPVYYEDDTSSMEYLEAGQDFYLRNRHPPYDKDRPSLMNPPFHYHIYQTESFHILEGACTLYQDTTAAPFATLSAVDPDAPKTASIPNMVYHTLRNASTTDSMLIDVKLSPEDAEAEQLFFRNFFGYLDDCRIAHQAPSFFQLTVFLKASDTPKGLPMPTKWLGLVVSRIFLEVISWWGRNMLGYKESYDAYYTPPGRP